MESGHEEDSKKIEYHAGFGNHFESEAIKGALPRHRNTPQQCNFGLYAEQLSGTPFTYPRAKMQRSWLYRIMPTVAHLPYETLVGYNNNWISHFDREDDDEVFTTPAQMRWQPVDVPKEKITFIQGIQTISGAGGPAMKVSSFYLVSFC
jgi:homogentisate 1,2-dioxygenase